MSVLQLDDAKLALGLQSVTTYDVELQDVIDAAEAALGRRIGPLEPVAYETRATAAGGLLLLPAAPVVELTTVTPVGGTALTLTDLYLDQGAGVIRDIPDGEYDVEYTSGRATCPPDLLLAAKELVRHLWQTKQGPRPGAGDQVPGASYALPNRVLELIAPYETTI